MQLRILFAAFLAFQLWGCAGVGAELSGAQSNGNPGKAELQPDSIGSLYNANAVSIKQLTPDSGYYHQTTMVKIIGAGFESDMRVYFGRVESANVRVLSKEELVCEAPSQPAGTVDVRFYGAAGMLGIAKQAFKYTVPADLAITAEFVSNGQFVMEDVGLVSMGIRVDLNGYPFLPYPVEVSCHVTPQSTAKAGTDFFHGVESTRFPAGTVNGQINRFTVVIVDDSEFEGIEAVEFQLDAVMQPQVSLGLYQSHQVLVRDNEPEQLIYSNESYNYLLKANAASDRTSRLSGWGYGNPATIAGATFDANQGVILGVSSDSQLICINPETGEGVPIGGLNRKGISCIAMDSSTGVLYGIMNDGYQHLAMIDPETCEVATISTLNVAVGAIQELAFHPDQGMLYALNTTAKQLWKIHPATGETTFVGTYTTPSGSALWELKGLEVNLLDGGLYGVAYGGNMYRFDMETGAAVSLGDIVDSYYTELVFDSSRQEMRLIHSTKLRTLDVQTLQSDFIGNISYGAPWDLAYDPRSGTVYGAISQSPAPYPNGLGVLLVRMNVSTSRITPIGFVENNLGIAFDPETGVLFGIDKVNGDLHSIDVLNGQLQYIGSTGQANISKLVYDSEARRLLGVAQVSGFPLFSISPDTAEATEISSGEFLQLVGFDQDTGELFHVNNGTLYGRNPDNGYEHEIGTCGFMSFRGGEYIPDEEILFISNERGLVTVDAHTAIARETSQFGRNCRSLAFDRNTGVLYGLANEAGKSILLSIDPLTGTSTTLGTPWINGNFDRIAWNNNENTLYAVSAATNELQIIDVQGGTVSSVIGDTGHPQFYGLTFDDNNNTLYGVVLESPFHKLATLNLVTGSATPFGTFPSGTTPLGVAINPDNGYIYVPKSDFKLYELDPASFQESAVNSTAYEIHSVVWVGQ